MSIRGVVGRIDDALGSGLIARQKSSSTWLARLCDTGGHGIESLLVPDNVNLWSRWTEDRLGWTCDDERARDCDDPWSGGSVC